MDRTLRYDSRHEPTSLPTIHAGVTPPAPEALRSPSTSAERRHRRAQAIKWTVYTLLLLNGSFYLVEEIQMAAHTLKHGASFLEWTEAFATTIDNLAWYGLLFMFEMY